MSSKNITHEQSIRENLSDYTMEVGSSFEQMSVDAVRFFDNYVDVRVVTDLGCGDGASVNEFKKLGYMVTGVDINQTKLDQIKGAKTVCADFLNYLKAQPDGSIENVFTHHALEHYPFYHAILGQIARTVSGYCLIIVPYGGEFRGTHHAVYTEPMDLVPPGFTPVLTEKRTRQEDELWVLSRA